MDVVFHLAGPAKEAPEVMALTPHELPELEESDLLHLDASVGLDAPEEIGTAPGCETMSLGGVPEKAGAVPHAGIINTKAWAVQKRQYRNERHTPLARRTADTAVPHSNCKANLA
jgi:hypothetical protein